MNFRLAGFEVDTANRGEAALRSAAERPPDVVVLDVMLPGMSGHEVAERLRAEPATAEVPIVMLSARTQDEDRERSYASGAFEYVTKPFEPSDLVDVVRRAMERPTGHPDGSP